MTHPRTHAIIHNQTVMNRSAATSPPAPTRRRAGAGAGGGGRDLAVGRVFAALADPTRRAILDRLAATPAGPTALAKHVGVSQPAVTKHLHVLQRAGLIQRRIHGRNHWCLLRAQPLADASAWLDRYREFWQDRLESLAALFEPRPPAPTPTDPHQRPRTPRRAATKPTRTPRSRSRP